MENKEQNRQTICRKIQIFPIGDKEEIDNAYKYIRDGIYSQYRAMNLLMGQLMSEFYKYNMDYKSVEFKNFKDEHLKNTNSLLDEISYVKGLDSKSLIVQKVKKDFDTSLKNGLCRGERSVNNYKRDSPLLTRSRDLKFCHQYENYNEFLEKLNNKDLEVNIKWVHNIKFKVVFGSPKKSGELRNVIKNIFEEFYIVQGSSIEIDDENKIILNLSISIPKKERNLDENIVVGVDLGIAIPAVCAVNNTYSYFKIGNKDDFFRVRTQLQNQRRRLQRNLKFAKGGHGRKEKLKALDKLKDRESNFVQTYNHMVSKM
jgi:hypothetical protein